MKKLFGISLVLALVSYGIFLRGFDLDDPSFWIDEGFSTFVGYAAFQHGYLPILPNGTYEFTSFLFTFFQSLSFGVFGVSDFSARFPSLFLGIMHIGVFYLLAKSLFSYKKYPKYFTFLALFLFVFSTWQILWSREARFYECLGFLTTGGVYLFSQYLFSKQKRYLFGFFLLCALGMLFHYFYFVVFIAGILILFLESKDQKINHKVMLVSGVGLIVFLYVVINQTVKIFAGLPYGFGYIFPQLQTLSFDQSLVYMKFYIGVLWSQLGIIFLGFLGAILFAVTQKQKQMIGLVSLIFFLQMFLITAKSEVAHSRYIYHIFSIITLFGVAFYAEIFQKGVSYFSSTKAKILLNLVCVGLLSIGIFITYDLTFVPKKIYYIDETSPKPNFKYAYKALSEIQDVKIVSGFPQLCEWYLRDKKTSCIGALNINLTGSKENELRIINDTSHHYTGTEYIKNITQLPDEDVYFVLDDLSLKNAVDRDIIAYVKDNCNSVFRDIGNGELENFIGVWKCKK